MKAAGLKDFKLHIGDLGLFRALLEAADMPLRWRRRLMHQFWRPDAFRTELKRLTTLAFDVPRDVPTELLAKLDPERPDDAEKQVAAYLDTRGVELFGTRSLSEITESLLSIVADSKTQPLSADTASLLESYIRVVAPARAAGARLLQPARQPGGYCRSQPRPGAGPVRNRDDSGPPLAGMRACPTPGTGLKSGGSEVLGLPVGCLAGMPHAAGPCSGAGMVILRMLETRGATHPLAVATRWHSGQPAWRRPRPAETRGGADLSGTAAIPLPWAEGVEKLRDLALGHRGAAEEIAQARQGSGILGDARRQMRGDDPGLNPLGRQFHRFG